MAEYEPLLSRAVASLHDNRAEREAVYLRARRALLTQLRKMDPPVPEEKIEVEAQRLMQAVDAIEAQIENDASRNVSSNNAVFKARRRRRTNRLVKDTGNTPLSKAANIIEKVSSGSPIVSVSREDLVEVASPAASITSEGRLDAGPNSNFDIPTLDEDLASLPLRQNVLIKTILSDLPRNSPKSLAFALESYREEIITRGSQPIVGILRDTAFIIEAAIGSESARQEWLNDSMQAAFARFLDNHVLFVKHFPLDFARKEIYARTKIDHSRISNRDLKKAFRQVAMAAKTAQISGVTTKDFAIITEKLSEFLDVIASLPDDQDFQHSIRDTDESDTFTSAGARKNIILTGLGFLEKAYNLAGSTATLATTQAAQHLLSEISNLLHMLSSIVHL